MNKNRINFYPIINSIQKMALYETKAVSNFTLTHKETLMFDFIEILFGWF